MEFGIISVKENKMENTYTINFTKSANVANVGACGYRRILEQTFTGFLGRAPHNASVAGNCLRWGRV